MWDLGAPRHRPHSPETNILTFLSALLQTSGDFQEDRVLMGALIWTIPESLLSDLAEESGRSSRGHCDTEESHTFPGEQPGALTAPEQSSAPLGGQQAGSPPPTQGPSP